MLVWIRDQLTPGQRWTTALAAGLAAAVLMAGLPEQRQGAVTPALASDATPEASGSAPAAGPAEIADRTDPVDPDGTEPLEAPDTIGFTPPAAHAGSNTPAAAAPAPPAATGGPPADVGAPAASEPAPPPVEAAAGLHGPPRIAALVRSGEALPGRDDASIAAAFLERSTVEAEMFDVDEEDPELCHRVGTAADLVMAGEGLPPDLRTCLAEQGLHIVAFDHLGGTPLTPEVSPGGGVLSTRRGAALGLLDLARWDDDDSVLAGSVGLVTTTALEASIESIRPRLAELGISVEQVVYLEEDVARPDLSEHVLEFARAGVEVVVFALPVSMQRQWVERHSLLDPAVRYVVADAYDAVVEEAYPPMFDGAVAYTSIQVPWRARTEGPTAEQERCEDIWTDASGTPVMLGAVETIRAFAWCQHIELVTSARERAAAGVSLGEALQGLATESVLTAPLGPGVDGAWGPRQDAALTWRSGCRCWEATRLFADRPPSHESSPRRS
jgi:hypothetical protein